MRLTEKTVLLAHPGGELFGTGRMLAESAAGLHGAGFRVVAVLPTPGPLAPELRSIGVEVRIAPMFILHSRLLRPRGWPSLVWTALTGALAAWRTVSLVRPDVVYVSTTTIPQWPLVAQLRDIRTVSHIHEARRSGSRMWNRLLHLPHLASQRTLVNSRFSLSTVRWALPALADRAEIVHNGIASPEHPKPPREPLEGPLRLLYMGPFSPQKGPDLALDAANLLQRRGISTHLTLLGTSFDGHEWFGAELRERAADGDAEVDVVGFQRDVWPYLAATDVLLTPSRTDESFGNTAVEGILALRPVVASDSSGLREAAGEYPTSRLVPPGDYRAIADALGDIVANWPMIIETLLKSRRAALERHDPALYRARIARVCATAAHTSEPRTERRPNPRPDTAR